jgi:hypothetical protein
MFSGYDDKKDDENFSEGKRRLINLIFYPNILTSICTLIILILVRDKPKNPPNPTSIVPRI